MVSAKISHTDVIIMHCLGYSEKMRDLAERGSGTKAVTVRRLVANNIDEWITKTN